MDVKELKIEKKELTTELLIIGGGIGGLTAAVIAKEKNPNCDVLIVEKQTAGYSGKANRGGGVLQYFDLENMHPMEFVGYHANAVGCFLGNQPQMLKYVSMNGEMIGKLESWGVKVPRHEDGSLKLTPTGPLTYIIGVDLDLTLQIRRRAEKLGVKILDKITISDLLTKNQKAIGATGYSLIDGTFYTFSAKSVILATGSQNYRIVNMWASGRGDGIAAAYRAGAEMRNAEFGNFAQLFKVKSHHELVFNENCLYNAYGENITKNFRFFPEADINSDALKEWYLQMSAGKGPVIMKPDTCPMTQDDEVLFTTSEIWHRPYGLKFWQTIYRKCHSVDVDNELAPGFLGEQSPVKVDNQMQTTIKNLYAIGDVSYAGSCVAGAVPAPPGRNRGSGILNAVFAAIVAAEDTVAGLADLTNEPIDVAQVEAQFNRTFAPLMREEGYTAKEIIQAVQAVIAPVENSIYMSGQRIDVALKKVEAIKEMVKEMKADDYHYLLSCHEAEAMVISAEMFFKASKMREETRGWFRREDFPKSDNENWLKWIVIKNQDDNMVFSTEDVPVSQYPIKPMAHM
jgi:succinate dehydrogenase/fumarate reductase flavoprotein subunit